MSCVIERATGLAVYRWIVVMRLYRDFRMQTYSFVVTTSSKNVFDLLDVIKPAFVDPEHREVCTAALYGQGKFLRCYFIYHDRSGKDSLACALAPLEAPLEISGKGSMWYDDGKARKDVF